MGIELSGLFQLREDVLIVPVEDLPEEARAQIEFDPGDRAVSRLQSRGGSKIIGAEAADVLGRFKEPRSVVEAVILFGREKNIDPNQVLSDAYPFLQGMVEAGFLVRAAETIDGSNRESHESVTWGAGTTVLDARVVRTFQVFDDTEVLLLSRPDGRHSVLKVARRGADGNPVGTAKARLEHEAEVLRGLDVQFVPVVLSHGEIDNRRYVEIEFIPGVDSAMAAAEWRQRDSAPARRRLLALAQSIARAYASLHGRGVIHGDVHPRNVLVLGNDSVRLIDFGMAVSLAHPTELQTERGGMPFFFEPELAQAYLTRSPAPPASASGEQHGVAALIYYLITGAYWQDFHLGREAMMEDIATKAPLSFSERDVQPWPEVERVLQRALAKSPSDRFVSMADFVAALEDIAPPPDVDTPGRAAGDAPRLIDEALANASLDASWDQGKLAPAPATSINYGSAGIALGLLHIAQHRGDAEILALADSWSLRALAEIGEDDAFYNPDIQITRDLVGEASPFHSPSGVHAVAALVATAKGDPLLAQRSLLGFLEAIRRPLAGLDLTLGQSSVLLASAILLDALQANRVLDQSPLREAGNAALRQIWAAIDAKPRIALADIEYLGIAHGWAGILYATLQWCRVSGSPIPRHVEPRLDELAALALPAGRGLEWPWLLNRPGEPMTMAGWCNGTCGYVFLWNLAHRLIERSRYFELAQGAAWRSWDADEPSETLCCGLAGRGYALLNMYRSSGDAVWVDRARDLIQRATRGPHSDDAYGHSLYKGRFGLAVLAAEIEHPDEATMPFFEPAGYLA